MTFKEYSKWLAVGLFGFMGLSWDAMFFASIIYGKGQVTIWENNLTIAWIEFGVLTALSIFVLAVTIKHLLSALRRG